MHAVPLQALPRIEERLALAACTRSGLDKVEAEITKITRDPWTRRVITWQLDGRKPRDLRLTWSIDPAARAALEEEVFGKHVLITDHDDWPAAEVIAAYRSQNPSRPGGIPWRRT